MKQLFTILLLGSICLAKSSLAQEKYVPFQPGIQPFGLAVADGMVVIKAKYNYEFFVPYFLDTPKYRLVPFTDLNDGKWKAYYGQTDNFAIDKKANDVLIYGSKIKYFFDSDFVMDSIAAATSINRLQLAEDSLIYASIRNNNVNYIVRRKGRLKEWQHIPFIIADKREDGNTALVGWLLSMLLLLGAILYWWFRHTGITIESIKKRGNRTVDLKLLADKPLSLSAFERYEKQRTVAAEASPNEERDSVQDDATGQASEMNKDTWEAIKAIKDVIVSQHTPLPLTVAINGAWGSGKSSIMNCIKELLERDEPRFLTTWFNAWHQQTEGDLLNAFLLKIINRCEKAGPSLRAFSKFRLRLFHVRFMKQSWLQNFATGALLAFMVFFVLELVRMVISMNHSEVSAWWPVHSSLDWENMFADNKIKIVTTVVVPILSFFFFRSEKLSTLGIFGSLISRKQFLIDSEKNAPDMREKFRTQYWEIMKANRDQTLVVFIDDLDRVDGSKIFDMLEALNFISDVTSRPDDTQENSLKAVFVLGMYIDQIALNLGKFLQKQGNQDAGNIADNGLSQDEKARKLGHQYIEKMVQLNVPVPLLK